MPYRKNSMAKESRQHTSNGMICCEQFPETHNVIETGRLFLRPWCEADSEALYKYASDSRVSEQALWPCHTSVEMSRRVIRDIFAPNPHCFAIVLKETNEPIGCIGLVPDGAEHHSVSQAEREAGYWIGHPYWGQGLATESLEALICYCRDRLRLSSLLITADAGNTASHRVARKCGFRLVENYEYDGTASKAFRLGLVLTELRIEYVRENKHDYIDLLLVGDESEAMIHKYLECSDLYVGFLDGVAVAVIVVSEIDSDNAEVKNLAVAKHFRRQGIGCRMLNHVEQSHRNKRIILGTGETPSTLSFYKSCGYRFSHRIKNFFTDNYPDPIIEEGVLLNDMIYLSKEIH